MTLCRLASLTSWLLVARLITYVLINSLRAYSVRKHKYSRGGGSGNFQKGRGPVPSPPLPFSPLPSPPLPLPSPPFALTSLPPPLPLRSRAPLIQLGGLVERCKLPQPGPGQSPGRKRIWCTLKLWESHWWQSLANVNSCSRSLFVVVRPSVCLSVCRL